MAINLVKYYVYSHVNFSVNFDVILSFAPQNRTRCLGQMECFFSLFTKYVIIYL